MAEYLLNNHVHVRATLEGAILLDLRRDEYISLNTAQASVLAGLVRGWPQATSANPAVHLPSSATEFVDALMRRKLITADPGTGKVATQAELEPADRTLANVTTALTLADGARAAAFLASYARVAASLRFRSLERTIDSIARRKLTVAKRSSDSQELQHLVGVFLMLRPFLYTARRECLFDSLVLMHYLSAHGYRPKLVFGITTDHFEAHAWVQAGPCVLNCALERVRAFSPILVV